MKQRYAIYEDCESLCLIVRSNNNKYTEYIYYNNMADMRKDVETIPNYAYNKQYGPKNNWSKQRKNATIWHVWHVCGY